MPLKTATRNALFLLLTLLLPAAAAALEAERTADNRIIVRRAGATEPLLIQNARPDFRPYIHPIMAPDGRGILTENSPGHHQWQHGLYVGLNKVNGHDFWMRDDVFHPRPMAPPVVLGNMAQWVVDTLWTPEPTNAASILEEVQRWTLTDLTNRCWLDLEWTLTAHVDVIFGRADYGGLFLRMPWTADAHGDALSSEGAPKDGMRARWMAVRMDIKGRDDGATMAILDDPKNAQQPMTWRVDGQLGIAPSRCIAGEWKLAAGQSATARYRVLILGGRATARELEAEFRQFAGAK